MQDQSTYHQYIRKWWRWLLLAIILGALAGAIFYALQEKTDIYRATTVVDVGFNLNIVTEYLPTEELVVDSIENSIARLNALSNFNVELTSISVEHQAGTEWWKPVVLGTIIGTLAMFAIAMIWEDYRRGRQSNEFQSG